MARILIVDDVPENLDLLAYVLGRSGHDVVTALGGRAGLERVHEVHPDAVLVDLRMPVVDGWEVARWIRADPALDGIRLIAVSVGSWGSDPAGKEPFDAFLALPFEPADMVAAVEGLLESRSAR